MIKFIVAVLLAIVTSMPLLAQKAGGYQNVEAGGDYVMVLKKDGSLWAWGSNKLGELGDGSGIDNWTPTKILEDVKQVSAGGNTTFAIKNDGTLWGWGWNKYG